MSTRITVHQRVALWLSDYRSISDEWLAELYAVGARVICVHLNNVGEVPRSKVDAWQTIVSKDPRVGYKVGGAIWPGGEPLRTQLWRPADCSNFANSEIRRLGLNGPMQFNMEADVQQADLRGERWSEQFVSDWRQIRPKYNSVLNTYPVEGLNHAPYIGANFRLCCQTSSSRNLWEWPPTWYCNAQGTGWAQRVGWPKAKIKMCLPVFSINGEHADPARLVSECAAAGTIGATLYPTESYMPPSEYVAPLTKALILARAAY